VNVTDWFRLIDEDEAVNIVCVGYSVSDKVTGSVGPVGSRYGASPEY
jgi:hypothetical protein